jgi:hypothetical protein
VFDGHDGHDAYDAIYVGCFVVSPLKTASPSSMI